MATPPDFSVGQVLTSAAMNQVGLWLIKTQTIGTTVSSVTVTGAFTADFANYKILISGGVASATTDLQLRLGATTTGYRYGLTFGTSFGTPSGTASQAATTTGTHIRYAGTGSANTLAADITVIGPQLAKRTVVTATLTPTVDTQEYGFTHGMVADTTQYTSFIITPNTGTLTGGVISVYGYRK